MYNQGKESFQITGDVHESEIDSVDVNVSNEDVEMVAGQAGVSQDAARKALEEAEGDIAKAIIDVAEE